MSLIASPARPLARRVEVRPSKIHGLGVFARTDFETGEYIGRYIGHRTDVDSMYTLWVEYPEGQRGYFGTGRLRHLNHSRTPNAEFDGRDLFAMRPIRAGEEITVDYGEEWADVP